VNSVARKANNDYLYIDKTDEKMKIDFRVEYKTKWGEELLIVIDDEMPKKMQFNDGFMWSYTYCDDDDEHKIKYHYEMRDENGKSVGEWGSEHTAKFAKEVKNGVVIDRWQGVPEDKPFYSSAFSKVILGRKRDDETERVKEGEILIKVMAPTIKPDEVLAIAGNTDETGNWEPSKALTMNCHNFPEWSAKLAAKTTGKEIEYKFIIKDKKSGEIKAWETGLNRKCTTDKGKATIITWQHIESPLQRWKGAGTAIPVFSLRTKKDMGCGDFYDLMKLTDWADNCGQRIIQILPINDTTKTHTWHDSYPYNANSAFALHPMYLRPNAIGELKDAKKRAEYNRQAIELNKLATVDYEKACELKYNYVRDLYDEQGEKTTKSKAFKNFVKDNSHWLKAYVAYSLLRDINGTADFRKWGHYAKYDEKAIDKFLSVHKEENKLVCYVQYHLDKQLKEAVKYAHSHNVVLKGDIPIGVSRDSVDAWVSPEQFNMDSQAGAPPDSFSKNGQNWGFPTYNWEYMQKDGFKWWKHRLEKMAEYCDAYRIDHILGFFRIWQIPTDTRDGVLGTFYPALPYSKQELQEKYGFELKDEYTKPQINRNEIPNECAEETVRNFLDETENGIYRLKEGFDNQRKIEDYFNRQGYNSKNQIMREMLLKMTDDVLLIEDRKEKCKYHPRIEGQTTNKYKKLSEDDRRKFDAIHEDFFYHRHDSFWEAQAMSKLPPLVDATKMLACGEDLGMIPGCVAKVMNALKILSLEIQRMPKEAWKEFGNTSKNPYYSVAATSTHDMTGVRGWWESDREKAQRYYNEVLKQEGTAPEKAEPWLCEMILKQELQSPSILAILPLQDWLSTDGTLRRKNAVEEQINNPADSNNNWNYRMHIGLEALVAANDFNKKIKQLIEESGR
jgi:4-alpha-glucanotransferase